ncbi:unnamed protein product [Callosobruchus maculatus]|uniref:Uncharacterized protein n=1 Tax=Callosobruchus maculatus TaxID=64391 RepID=A0A653C580_CALMS|nr:unnamed protein product [Callosobruchus maculatus]
MCHRSAYLTTAGRRKATNDEATHSGRPTSVSVSGVADVSFSDHFPFSRPPTTGAIRRFPCRHRENNNFLLYTRSLTEIDLGIFA